MSKGRYAKLFDHPAECPEIFSDLGVMGTLTHELIETPRPRINPLRILRVSLGTY